MNDIFDGIHLLLKSAEYDEALKKLYNIKLESINPPYDTDLNHSWYIVGDIFYKNKSYFSAIKAFKNALIDEPDDIEASLALSNSYSEVDLHKESIITLEKALLVEKANEKLNYNLGNAWFDLGNYKVAIKYYRKIIKDEILYSLSSSNIDACYYNIKKHDTRPVSKE